MSISTTIDLQTDIDIVRTLRPEIAQFFAVDGPLPLTRDTCAAVYSRQSDLELQAGNNMRLDYLAVTAGVAVTRRLTVPRAYVIHDFESGSHMSRPGIEFIRKELIAKRRICALIIAQQDRFTREPLHYQLVRKECEDYGVLLLFADGIDDSNPFSEMIRVQIAFMSRLWRQRLREGNLGGRRAHVRKGNVRIGGAPLGFIYRRDEGRTWYEIDGLRADVPFADADLDWPTAASVDAHLEPYSPAWLVVTMFRRYAYDGWSSHRLADWLTERGVPPSRGHEWHPGVVLRLLQNQVYTGTAYYNRTVKLVNPAAPPPADYTAERKRTILREKPVEDWNEYHCPRLISDRLLALITEQRAEHTGHKGSSMPRYPSLLRGYICCPSCLRFLTLRWTQRQKGPVGYYYCNAYQSTAVVRASCTAHHSYRFDVTEAAARAGLLALVQHPEYLERAIAARSTDSAAPTRAQVAHMQHLLDEKEATRARFISLLGEQVITREEFDGTVVALRVQIDELRAALLELRGVLARQEEEETNWDFARAALRQAELHADADLDTLRTFIHSIRGYYVPAGEQMGWHIRALRAPGTGVSIEGRCSTTYRGHTGLSLYLATG